MSRDFDFKNMELETDAQSLKFMIDLGKHCPHHELSTVINDISGLLSIPDWIVIIKHIPRASNSLAHALAAYAHTMDVAHKTHFIIQLNLKKFVSRICNSLLLLNKMLMFNGCWLFFGC